MTKNYYFKEGLLHSTRTKTIEKSVLVILNN
jgi:hypothetical protein